MGDPQIEEVKENSEFPHFCQCLADKMAKSNKQLLEQCTILTTQTDELRARMAQAMNNAFKDEESFPFAFIQRGLEKKSRWIEAIGNEIEQTDQRIVLFTASKGDWFASVEQRAEALLGGDEFTMLPFNDVVNHCHNLKVQTEISLNETTTAKENVEYITLTNELEQLQLDAACLAGFEDEMRLEKQKLNMIIAEKQCKRRQSFIFKSGLQFRKVENLKLTIAELETKIKLIESI